MRQMNVFYINIQWLLCLVVYINLELLTCYHHHASLFVMSSVGFPSNAKVEKVLIQTKER